MMILRLLFVLLLGSYTYATSVSSASSSRSSSARTTREPCNGEPRVPSSRKACNYYVWDVRSALLYRWCHHLLKDHIYEGRGGKMFVRFESNSILQLLYPCSRYAPNRCMVCGGNFSDHLQLWWSKHLYTPWDLYMDKTYKEGEVILQEEATKSRKGRKQTAPVIVSAPRYAFHKQYVQDVSDVIKGVTNLEEQRKLVKEKLGTSKKGGKNKPLDRRMVQFPKYGVAYLLPTMTKWKAKSKLSFFTLGFARGLCLFRILDFVEDQESENERLQNRS